MAQEFYLENMFQPEMKLVESSPPLITPNPDREREEQKKNLREGLPCHC